MNKIILVFAAVALGSMLIVTFAGAGDMYCYFAIFIAMISSLVALALVAAVHGPKLMN